MPEPHAITAATEALTKLLAGPVQEPRYLVLQVIRALDDAEAQDADADAKMVDDMAGDLAQIVHDTFIEWARTQPDYEPSWMKPWTRRSDVDTAIAIVVANRVLAHLTARKHRLILIVDGLIRHERQTRADVLRLYETRADDLRQPW